MRLAFAVYALNICPTCSQRCYHYGGRASGLDNSDITRAVTLALRDVVTVGYSRFSEVC